MPQPLLPEQQQRLQQQHHLQQPLPSTRTETTGAATSSGGGGANNNAKTQHQSSHAARVAEAVSRDLAALSNPDVSSPFSSLEDAVDRLLPYHVR